MDKREAVRVPVRVRAECRCSGIVIHGLVEDLSRSGLFLRVSNAMDPGVMAEIDLDVPGEDAPLKLSAEVVRIEQTPEREGLAFRFLGVTEASRPLANFIMRQHSLSR